MTWIESHLGDWVVRHRWLVIFLTIPTIAIAATGIRHIKICNDTRVFFTEENPDYQTLKALELTYSKEQSIFLVVAPKDGNVFTRQTLAAMSELTDAGWRIPHAIRVNSPTNFPHTRVEGDDLIVENLVRDPNSLTDAQLDEVRQIALSETAMVNRLISPRGHVAGIYIAFITPPEDTQAETQAAEGARQVADGFRARHPDIDLYLTGSVMIDHAFAQASRSDMMTLIPTACLVMTVLVGISLRSFYGTFAAVVVTILSMITALGLTGWLGVPLNAVTVGAPGLMLTLAVADNVHVLTTMFHRVRQGDSKHAAIAKSMQVNLKAIFLTNVTTIIGFLSMNFSDSPPFRDMGNLVGTGVAVDLVNSILLLPALMAVLPVHIHPRRERAPWIDMNRVADFVIRRRRSLLASMLVLTALASTGILRIELDDNFLTYFDDTFEFRRATDFLTKNLTGWDVIEYSLGSGQSGGITDPEYLAVVDRFADWYRRQPKVVHVSAITDTMKRLNQDMHGGDAGYYRIPDQRELAAQYLLFYELSLPFGTDLNGQIDVDKSAARFTVVLQSMSAKELSRMEAVARRWLDTNAPACMHADATGLSLIWARITQRNIGSMLFASFMEIVIIAGLMFLVLRSVKFVVIFLIPNLVPPFIAFGIWGLAKGHVGLALSVIIAMTLGIIVDDTIHFFVKYFAARREHGMSPEQAVRHAFQTVVAAIGITTVVLVAGFLVMTLSHYKMSAEMGMMCAMVIGLALMSDFFLTPALLMKFDRVTDKFKSLSQEANAETGGTDKLVCRCSSDGPGCSAGPRSNKSDRATRLRNSLLGSALRMFYARK